MKFEFSNDELFVLCALHGCETVVGISDTFEGMTGDQISEKLKKIVEGLKEKKLMSEEDGSGKLSDTAEGIVDIVAFPSATYIVTDETESEYIFCKNGKSVYMINHADGKCVLESFDEKEAIVKFAREKFDFIKVHNDTTQYMLSVPSAVMDSALGKASEGRIEDAVNILDGDEIEREEMENMLHAITYPYSEKTIICSKNSSNETLVKICTNSEGSWIVRISTEDEGANATVFKATENDITKIVFEF